MFVSVIKKYIFPILSVYLAVYYCYVINFLHRHEIVSLYTGCLLLIPLLFYDFIVWNSYQNRRLLYFPKRRKEIIFLSLRFIFWLVVYIYWVIILPLDPGWKRWLDFVYFSIVPMLGMVYMAERYLSIIGLLLWLISYYFLTVRKRVLQIFTSFILPGIISIILFEHYYFLGGLGNTSIKEITRQKGVELFFSKENFPKIDYFHHRYWTVGVRHFPRDIMIDPKDKVVYTNYASTYGGLPEEELPAIVSVNLISKETKYFLFNGVVRTIHLTDKSILCCPWGEYRILEIDKNSLSILREISAQVEEFPWEIIEIYCDRDRNRIYLANDMTPMFLEYDYTTGKLITKWFPEEYRYGGTLWCLQKSERTGYFYILGFGTDANIYEIDPGEFKIRRKLVLPADFKTYIGTVFENPLFFIPSFNKKFSRKSLNLYGGSALGIDDDRGTLYMQDGGSDRLFEIDIESFKVKRVLKGEIHARKIHIDKKRGCLYILSYFYGNLICIDLVTGEHLWKIKVGGKPYSFVVHDDICYVNSVAGIVKINLNQYF